MLIEINGQKVKLPDFFIVGAGKSGTTSLAKYLATHPQIYIPEIKEPQFFSFYGVEYNNNNPQPFFYIKKWEDYISLFQKASENQVLGEASTWYSINQTIDRTIENIKKIYSKHISKLRFIFIVRNPIERVFSAYTMYVAMGLENLPFEEAIFLGNERIQKGYRLELNYIENMLISDSVQKYLNLFEPKQVKIYLYEDLKRRPIWLLQNIFEFLEVDPKFIPPNLGIVYNVSGVPKSTLHKIIYNFTVRYNPLKPLIKKNFPDATQNFIFTLLRKIFYTKPQMSPEMREKLKKIFKEDILKLQELIERDLSHWLK